MGLAVAIGCCKVIRDDPYVFYTSIGGTFLNFGVNMTDLASMLMFTKAFGVS